MRRIDIQEVLQKLKGKEKEDDKELEIDGNKKTDVEPTDSQSGVARDEEIERTRSRNWGCNVADQYISSSGSLTTTDELGQRRQQEGEYQT